MNQIYNHFNFFSKKNLPLIVETQLSKIIETKHPVWIAESFAVKGNVTPLELTTLSMFAKAHNPKTIFEIGTFDGRTTLNLALNSSPDTKIYTIDLPKNGTASPLLPVTLGDKGFIDMKVTGSRFLNKDEGIPIEKDKIVQLYGDTATFDFAPYFKTVDMVFIDGAHSYEYVMNDSKIAFKLLRNKKGVILWHDYNSSHKGVMQALDELQLANIADPAWKMFHIEDTTLVCLINR